MASSYSTPIGPTQVGSYFVQQYYQVLQQQPDYVHQFYTDASSIVRVDGDSTEHASALVQIHTLIMSMSFSGIKIKTINSLKSWNGAVLVVASGSVKLKDINRWRNFVQTFLLAPQEKGYFVLNDVFHFVNEERSELVQAPVGSQNNLDAQPTSSNLLAEPPGIVTSGVYRMLNMQDFSVTLVSYVLLFLSLSCTKGVVGENCLSSTVHDYALEVEATEYVNSVNIQGNDAVEEYSYPEHDHENLYEAEAEVEYEYEYESEYEHDEADPEETHLGEETAQVRSFEEETSFPSNVVEVVPEPEPAAEEPVGEPSKLSYASILRAPKGPAPSVRIQPSYTKSAPPVSEWQPPVEQSISMPPAAPEAGLDLADEGFSQEGESKSVYVRNLPSTVSSLDILQEFKNYGKIKQDGVFLRNRKDVGICYAFVEFEEVQGVQNAIKASPIQLAGRQVYIEERRPTSSSVSRGGRSGRGRGRGGRPAGRPFGRGSNPDDRYSAFTSFWPAILEAVLVTLESDAKGENIVMFCTHLLKIFLICLTSMQCDQPQQPQGLGALSYQMPFVLVKRLDNYRAYRLREIRED
ncbi:hypothetical protein MTR67_029559 [Solanum verrucosum]|uniref:G3BP-like protein n=1 Tax=Solanum verrucosum TaxID=315347 RepID=A0AAF0TXS4_SOLVR|nr:hypothetical protein MTR67_029559 [Solanum verrucosum]